FLLFFLGTLFKVGSSPLHVWVPDVYTGAANTITSFMMTIIKFASFAFLIRIFLSLEASGLMQYQDKLYYLFLVGSILSLLSGNLVGLLQSDFKRLLSYSSIGHTGFILIGLVCAMKGSESGYQIAISYLLYYMVASVGIMAVIKVVNPDN